MFGNLGKVNMGYGMVRVQDMEDVLVDKNIKYIQI